MEAWEQVGRAIIQRLYEYDIARVTFDGRVSGRIVEALREAGFYWTGEGWSGELGKLPSIVTDLEGRAHEAAQ